MKKSMLGLSIALMGVLAASADANLDFPYGQEGNLTRRYSLVGPTSVASFTTPVEAEKLNGGMQDGENLAIITSGVTSFTAVDEEDWDEATGSIGTAQAAFTLVSDANGVLAWKGLVGNEWVVLTGVDAAEGSWTSKIEIDYSNPANKLVRYSLNDMPLTYGGNAWLPLSGTSPKVKGVKVYGFGTVSGVTGDCGTYTVPIATTENVSMSYDSFTVTATLPDSWKSSVTGAKVVVHKEGDQTAVINATVNNGVVTATIPQGTVPAGAEYTYEVQVTSATEPTPQTIKTSSVKLYGEIDWFGFAKGAFVKATADDNIEIDPVKKTFAAIEDDDGDQLEGKITPATSANENSKIEVVTEIEVAGVTSYSDLPDVDDAQLSVTLAKGEDGNRTWLCKVGGEEESWTPTDVDVTGLTENGTYFVRVVFDYQSSTKEATVYVKKGDNGAETPLFEHVALSASKLAGASVMGGDVAYMNAKFQTTAPAEVVPDANKEIVLKSNVTLDLSKVNTDEYTVSAPDGSKTTHHISWKDAGGKYATLAANGALTVKSGTPANGLDSYMSYVLGLDATNSESKPLVKSVQNAEATKLTFTLPDLEPKAETETGVKVKFELQQCESPNGTFTSVGAPTDGTTINVDVPTDAVKYYKIGITAE